MDAHRPVRRTPAGTGLHDGPADVCESSGAKPRGSDGEGGHAHRPVHYPAKAALPEPVDSLKGVSSRCPRAEYTGRTNRIGTGSAFRAPSHFAGPAAAHRRASSRIAFPPGPKAGIPEDQGTAPALDSAVGTLPRSAPGTPAPLQAPAPEEEL
ncbi:hypothetical protein GCM10009760_29100 [Kitasatospora kazusensis]|uniref:Uncharacterized protein n=1 Tax=Kitasatospora kazusensis TaxID=407974 RepID=A0ABP5L7Z3_9ACTN